MISQFTKGFSETFSDVSETWMFQRNLSQLSQKNPKGIEKKLILKTSEYRLLTPLPKP